MRRFFSVVALGVFLLTLTSCDDRNLVEIDTARWQCVRTGIVEAKHVLIVGKVTMYVYPKETQCVEWRRFNLSDR